MASEIEELLFLNIRTPAEMGKQRFIHLALCGIILYNAASLMKRKFRYENFSVPRFMIIHTLK